MFRRIANLLKGFVSLFISGLEKSNPEAILEVESENLREQIGKYNQGLASHAGLCERLMAQVKQLERDESDFRAKASANLRAGNKDIAAQYALKLQTITRELEENRTQMKQAEDTYQNLLKARDIAISAAKAKIESLRQGINDLKVKRAMAELTEMASGMITSIGGSGDTLDRLQKMVEEERTQAAGRVRVAKDTMSMADINMQEAEQKALAANALADFAAKEGIAIPGEAGSPASGSGVEINKSMGPQGQVKS